MVSIYLKLIIAFVVIVFFSACKSYQFNDNASDALKSQTSSKVANINKSHTIKQKIAVVDACKNINLDTIDVNNLVFSNQVEQCLSASKEFYYYLLFLHKHNVKVASKKLQKFVEYRRAETFSLNSIVEIANKRLLAWLNRNSEIKQPHIVKPSLAIPKSEVILEKSEFETSQEFNKRIANAKGKIKQARSKVQQRYKIALDKYDKELATYHQALELEKKQRQALKRQIYLDILNEEVRHILGEPFISADLAYDADKEVFYANLSATNSNWQQPISIAVPKDVAPHFKEAIGELTPILGFDVNKKGELFISYIAVRFDFQNYNAKVEERATDEYVPIVEVVRI